MDIVGTEEEVVLDTVGTSPPIRVLNKSPPFVVERLYQILLSNLNVRGIKK